MLKVGIIGLGVGEKHIDGYRSSGLAEVVKICDFDRGKLHEVARRNRVKNLTLSATDVLDDPTIDVVSIASFDNYHTDQIIRALRHKKHVFVEKPLCLNQIELNNIKAAYSAAINQGFKPILSSNFILRLEDRFIKLKKCIENGMLGEIYLVETCYDYGRLKKITEGWRTLIEDYSVMHGGGIHVLDLVQWLTGKNYNCKSALASKVVTQGTCFKPPDAILSFGYLGSDIIAKVGANFGSQTRHFHQLKIYGTKGTFVHDCGDAQYYLGSEPDVVNYRDDSLFPSTKKGDLIPRFIDAIANDTVLDIDFDYVTSLMQTSIDITQRVNG